MYSVDYNLELDLVTISLIAQVLVGWYLVSIVHELPDMILPGACVPLSTMCFELAQFSPV